MEKKVLILGATGYLGAKLTQYLSEKDYKVDVIIRKNKILDKNWTQKIHKIYYGDIRDDDLLNGILKQKYHTIINLISLDHRDSENETEYVNSVNIMPTLRILDKLRSGQLSNFIYMSTMQVYGKVNTLNIDEDVNKKPQNYYGVTHLFTESIVEYYSKKKGINGYSLRLSNAYGPPVFMDNNCWWLVVNDLCKTAITENKIQLNSDGSAVRDFIFIDDVIRAIEHYITTDNVHPKNKVLNICSGESYSILELAQMVKNIYHRKYSIDIPLYLPDNAEKVDVNKKASTEDRIIFENKQMIESGYKPRKNLEEGIEILLDWLKQNIKN